MKKINICLLSLLFVTVLGCQSFTGFDFDSDAIVGGGAVAGKDYITGLQQSQKAREYFVKSNANASQKKTVTPGNDQGTGVVWTDDGGIVIPPGCSIEFENKGYCLDPHLPAPGAGHEMQFVRTASLIPEELQGTYRNLLKRSAAGDEDVKNNMQRLVWALRTAGSQDVMATHLTERQREILSECAENGSFEDYVYRHEMYGKIVEELKSKLINKIKSSTSVRVGNVVYDAFDLLDPDKGKQKVEAHQQSLISMGLNLPVTQTGFNYGELENGIFTDIKGTGTLSFKAKIANSTSQSYTFYPMNYAAQVGSGGSSVGFYAAANSGMCQRGTCSVPDVVEEKKEIELPQNEVVDWNDLSCAKKRNLLINGRLSQDSYNDMSTYNRDGMRVATAAEIGGAEFARIWANILKNFYEWQDRAEDRLSVSLYIDEANIPTLVFRGSGSFGNGDWTHDNSALVIGNTSAQSTYGRALVALLSANSPNGFNIVGHSLGGYLAVASSLGQSDKVLSVYTYNAPGIDSDYL